MINNTCECDITMALFFFHQGVHQLPSRPHRRLFMRSVSFAALAAIGTAFGLAACQTGQPNLSQLAVDTQALANGLSGVVSEIEKSGKISQTEAKQIETYLAEVEQAAAKIKSGGQSRPLVQQIVVAVNDLAAAASVPDLPPDVALGLQAANTLLPALEADLGLSAARAVEKPAMSPAMARTILAFESAR